MGAGIGLMISLYDRLGDRPFFLLTTPIFFAAAGLLAPLELQFLLALIGQNSKNFND